MRSAPPVTYTLPKIMGRIPKIPLVGFHFSPVRKSHRLTLPKKGRPLENRKKQMSSTARIQAHAVAQNTHRMTFSFIRPKSARRADLGFKLRVLISYLLNPSQVVTAPVKICSISSTVML